VQWFYQYDVNIRILRVSAQQYNNFLSSLFVCCLSIMVGK
jgi:hypothetical protein